MTEVLWSVASLAIVFGLLGALVFFSKYQSQALRRFQGLRRISIEDQIRVGQQCNLAVVRMDEIVYHIAVTPAGVQVLQRGDKEVPE